MNANFKASKLQKLSHKLSYSDKISPSSASQLNHKDKESFVSSVYLGFKICFSLLSIISLIKIGYTAKVRLTRLKEIQYSYLYEKDRFKTLSIRFDDLLSFKGEQRFMKDQDQMIYKDIIRVIWR